MRGALGRRKRGAQNMGGGHGINLHSMDIDDTAAPNNAIGACYAIWGSGTLLTLLCHKNTRRLASWNTSIVDYLHPAPLASLTTCILDHLHPGLLPSWTT